MKVAAFAPGQHLAIVCKFARLRARRSLIDGSIELAELYRTVEVREAMAGRRDFAYDRKRRLGKSDIISQILTSLGWTQTGVSRLIETTLTLLHWIGGIATVR